MTFKRRLNEISRRVNEIESRRGRLKKFAAPPRLRVPKRGELLPTKESYK